MGILKSYRFDERKEGFEKIDRLRKSKNKTLIVHYSCESFFNLEGRTPRITSICIKNRQSGETKAFSIHLQAQFSHVDLINATNEEIDILENNMLTEFGEYVKKHSTYNWVHWNMRNASNGFEAISNRSKIVGSDSIQIDDDLKFDLLDILGLIYTYEFVEHKPSGQLLNMAKLNFISTRDALTGKEEAEAFEQKDYLKLHMSTMRKVEIIDRILVEQIKNTIITKAKRTKIYGISIQGVISLVKNSPVLLLIWSIIVFILGTIIQPSILSLFGVSSN